MSAEERVKKDDCLMSDSCCAVPHPAHTAPPPPQRPWTQSRLWLVALSGLAIAAGAGAAQLGDPLISRIFYLAAIACTILTPARRAAQSIVARALDINALMIVAVGGALALGDWLEGAAVLWLFAI